MSVVDVKKLLEEISPGNPCGENLEYDPAFDELQRESQGKPEQQIGETVIPGEPPDWKKVRTDALKLFARTKDLRIAVLLTRALLNTGGFAGLRDGLELITQLLRQYWDSVHPQLDPQENDDPTLRLNTLAALCDHATILHELRDTPMVDSRTFGRFCLRDMEMASGKLAAPAGDEHPAPQSAEIDAAFLDCDPEQLQNTADAVNASLEHIGAIEKLLAENIGPEQATDLDELRSVLTEVQQIMSDKLANHGAEDSSAGDTASAREPAPAPAQPLSGGINSREDIIRVLDSACDYFARNEPSSPVPLLLRRAQRLISKDFMAIMEDIAPNAISQVEAIRGPDTKT
ncbi:MAG TPA: type VI secretion system protein TssA [Sedimenticola sp.]|nr:type VI secretion system protein TssA [Sedimenticola sp.]